MLTQRIPLLSAMASEMVPRWLCQGISIALWVPYVNLTSRDRWRPSSFKCFLDKLSTVTSTAVAICDRCHRTLITPSAVPCPFTWWPIYKILRRRNPYGLKTRSSPHMREVPIVSKHSIHFSAVSLFRQVTSMPFGGGGVLTTLSILKVSLLTTV